MGFIILAEPSIMSDHASGCDFQSRITELSKRLSYCCLERFQGLSFFCANGSIIPIFFLSSVCESHFKPTFVKYLLLWLTTLFDNEEGK